MENNIPIALEAEPQITFEYSKEREAIDELIAGWTTEKDKVKTRREMRENRKNVDEMRRQKQILEDETVIPDRTINTNIRMGKASYVSYITQAKRNLIITDISKPALSVEVLELWYTRGMRYPKWKAPWLKLIDAFHVHGGAALEIMYDPSKPLNNSFDFIARESLIFPLKTKNIQACPRILRAYELTTLQLEEFTEQYGFDPTISKSLLDRFQKRQDFLTVYRGLCKKDGIVYNYWISTESEKEWLRAPIVHDIGLLDFDPSLVQSMSPEEFEMMRLTLTKPLPLKQYPIVWFPYEITENEELLAGQGRAALDHHVQEAMTQMLTNTVNASTRASQLYPFVKNEPGQDPGMMELKALKPGMIQPREMGFFQPPWPNNIILPLMQAMQVSKANEAGHSDFAAMARKDANKTATEMELATDASQTIKNVDMDVYSSPVLEAYAISFKIACHQSIFGLCQRPTHPELLFGDYNLVPAGDVEVVKRAEDKQNAEKFFNIVQGTPAAEKVLYFLIQRFFPDQADEWLQALQGPDKDGIIIQLIQVLKTIPTDELNPEQQSQLATLIASASSVVGGSDDQTVPRTPMQQPPVPTEPSDAGPQTP